MKKTLEVVGLLALLVWTAGGVAAWRAAAGKVHVTVQEGDAQDESASRVDLLADQVATLSQDLRALSSAVEDNFSNLVQKLDEEGRASDARVRDALAASKEALERASATAKADHAVTDDLAAMRADLQRLSSAFEAASALAAGGAPGEGVPGAAAAASPAEAEPAGAATGAGAPAAETAASDPTAPDPGAAEGADPGSAATADATGDPAAEPAARRSFLSFKLPSQDFRFEGRQRFTVLTSLSRVGFDAKSTLHDFTGVSERLSGAFETDLAHPEAGITGRLEIPTDSLRTGLEGRDDSMLESLGAGDFATIVFEPAAFEGAKVDPEARTVTGTIRGRMTIHGTPHELVMPVRASVDESRRLVVEGEVPLNMSDYGVAPPSKLGVIKVEDGVRLWIRLRARALPAAEGGK